MTLGTGIFLSAAFLGLIFLYHSTKDRWNWTKGAKRLGFLAVGLVVLGGAAGLYAEYFYKSDYQIKIEREAKEKEEREKRDALARYCISDDILRMETIAKEIKGKLNMDMSLNEATKVIKDIVEDEVFIQPTEANIKELVAIAGVKTLCAHDFYFLVNVTAMKGEKIKSLRFWANNSPKGYTNSHLQEFSVDYAKLRDDRALESIKTTKKNVQRSSNVQEKKFPEHCAPNLTRKERLRRLALRGQLKQTSANAYVLSGNSKYSIGFTYSDRLSYCR